jgi:hypothetical protein
MTEDTAEPKFAEPGIARAIIEVLTRTDLPEQPVDGDCMIWADRITERLHERGVEDAETVFVTALDAAGAIVFMHKATRVYTLILDVTAQQFTLKLPPRWLSEEPNYIEDMTRETGVATVIISPAKSDG